MYPFKAGDEHMLACIKFGGRFQKPQPLQIVQHFCNWQAKRKPV